MFCFFKTPDKQYVCGSQGMIWRMEDSTAFTAPSISIATSLIQFDSTELYNTDHKNLIVSNTGTADLNITNIVSANPDFSASPANFTIPAGGNQTVDVAFTSSQPGIIAGVINISHNASSTNPLPVAVEGKGYLTIGIQQQSEKDDFEISPYPSSGIVSFIQNSSNRILIYNLHGKIISEFDTIQGNSDIINHLEKGYYLVKYIRGNTIKIKKLIVK